MPFCSVVAGYGKSNHLSYCDCVDCTTMYVLCEHIFIQLFSRYVISAEEGSYSSKFDEPGLLLISFLCYKILVTFQRNLVLEVQHSTMLYLKHFINLNLKSFSALSLHIKKI